MRSDDKQTLAAAILCLCPWLAVLVIAAMICEIMR
jgi:hypothetical protein